MGESGPFTVFPLLATKGFLLRKIKVSDAPNMFDYFSRKEVVEYYDVELLTSQQQAIELIEGLLYRYNAGKQIRWGITLKDKAGIIGTCGFHSIELEHQKAEIGYELHPDYWGRGIMTEIIQKIVEYGFNNMDLNRIEAFYNPLNHASRRVLEKNGFQYEGTLRERFLVNGKFVDAAIAAILKEEL